MVELFPHEFERVLPLYRSAGTSFPLISAVIQNKQRGQVFADDGQHPRAAVVVTDFGFMFLIGTGSESFDDEFAKLFATSATLKPSYLLWYSPPAPWQDRLNAVPNLGRRRDRVRLGLHSIPAGLMDAPVLTPSGFELQDLSAQISYTEKFGIDLVLRFWASTAKFLQDGFGVCLVKDNEILSLCYTAAVVDATAEVDVATNPDYRQRGFAAAVTRAFIQQSLRRGITPLWDCFDYDIASLRLAHSAGFTASYHYPLYSFNVPIVL